MAIAVAVTRTELDSTGLRRAAGRPRGMPTRFAECSRWPWCSRGIAERRRPGCAAWIARRCAIGFIATMTSVCRGCLIVCRRVASRVCHLNRKPRWRRWFATDRHSLNTALSAGGVSTCPGSLKLASACAFARKVLDFSIRKPFDSERFTCHVSGPLAERSVGDVLRRLGFRRLSARPRHPGHDAAAQAGA